MTHKIFCMLLKDTNYKIIIGLLFALFLVLELVIDGKNSLANENNSFLLEKSTNISKSKRTRRKPPSDYSRAGGSRGCPGENIPLTILAPNTFVGETTSRNPSFIWFISKQQLTEFRLFKLDKSTSTPKRIGVPIQHNSMSGINKLSFPSSQPPLAVGQRYIWQISINCSSGPFVKRGEFMVVQKPTVLQEQLSKVTKNSQKPYVYAQQGLWYEALEEALKLAPTQGKLGHIGSDILRNLASSDNFIPDHFQPEKTEILQKKIQQRKNYLQKIAGGS